MLHASQILPPPDHQWPAEPDGVLRDARSRRARPLPCAVQIGKLVEFKWAKYGHAAFNHKLLLAVAFTCLLLVMTVAGKPHLP
jgi:hypothetical protein